MDIRDLSVLQYFYFLFGRSITEPAKHTGVEESAGAYFKVKAKGCDE